MKLEKINQEFKKQLQTAGAATDKANAARDLLVSAIERVNDGFVALDSDWCYTYVNGRAARMLQREDPESLIGKHIWTEYPEGIGQPFHEAYLRAQATQKVVIFEEYYSPWDKWFENRIYPSEEGLSIFFTEITERKKSHESLNRVNRALKVLSRCNEILARTNDETELLEKICSVIAEEGAYPLIWIGFAEHDANKIVRLVTQKGFNSDFMDDVSISWAENIQSKEPASEAIRSGHPIIINDIFNDDSSSWWKDTAEKYAAVSSITLPIFTTDTSYGVLNIFSKTADAFNEEEVHLLQELANDLAFGIARLRSKIEQQNLQKQLQQAQKMEAVGQLTGGIAHDFNNILGCIMGYTDLAMKRFANKSEPKLTEYLSEVYQAGERGRDLVSQMLAFSSSSTGNARSISLDSVVKEVIHLLQSILPSSINLHHEIDNNVSNVIMDPTHLHQLVMNLCINARDALEGEGSIEVSVVQVNGVNSKCDSCHEYFEGDFVQLSVSDNGRGLDQTVIDKMFEPFFTTKAVGKGTGMGLSMVQRIVHNHAGHIMVETALGKGSAFHLLFPAVAKDENSSDVANNGFSKTIQNVMGQHLLVVDDDESMAVFLSELLELSGYHVSMMTDSVEALSLFQQNPQKFDLVITDQTMPGISGGELAQKMLQSRSDIPIILCTGYSEKIDAETCKSIGIKRLFHKPYRSSEILSSIAELLPATNTS